MTTEEAWVAVRKLLGRAAHLQQDDKAAAVADRSHELQELDRLRVELAQAVPGDVSTLVKETLACARALAEASPEEQEKRVRHLIHTTKELQLQETLAKKRNDLHKQVKALTAGLLRCRFEVGILAKNGLDRFMFVRYGGGDSWEEALAAAAKEKASRGE